jgi:hypothetical protein
MVNGIEHIKTLKCTIIKKEIIKGRDGDLLVNNLGPVVFKRRHKPQQSEQQNSESDCE